MKHPLVLLTLIFCSGIFFSSLIRIPFWPVYLLAAILIVYSFFTIKKQLIFGFTLLGLAFLSGVALLKVNDKLPRSHITNYVDSSGKQSYTIKGFIKSEPQFDFGQTTFIYKTQAMKASAFSRYCRGDILVRLKGRKELYYGEALLLRGNLYRPFGVKNSYRNYLYNQGIHLIMSVKSNADVVVLNENHGFVPKRFALCLKEKIEKIFSSATHPVSAAILEAMILGARKNIPPRVINSMMKTGTVHILVVSGFNVGIVAFIIILFLKAARVSRKPRFCITIALLIIYCLLTGASNPVVRATVMTSVFLSASFLKREPDIYNSLSIAALFILSLNPRQLFDIGFQLSFASVISIVYLYPKIKSFCRIDSLKSGCIRYVAEGLLVSFSAWAGTAGLIAYYFKIFSPIAIVANIFIVPLATLITLCGFSLIIISPVLPVLTPFFSATTESIVALLLKTNTFLINLPGAYFYL